MSLHTLSNRAYHSPFGLFFIKKINQTEKKPKPVQTDQFQFGLVFLNKTWFKPI